MCVRNRLLEKLANVEGLVAKLSVPLMSSGMVQKKWKAYDKKHGTAPDDFVKRVLRASGYAKIANNPEKFSKFRIMLKLPQKEAIKSTFKTGFSSGATHLIGFGKKKLLPKIKDPSLRTVVDLGTDALTSAGLTEATERIDRRFFRKRDLEPSRIRAFAKKYADMIDKDNLKLNRK
jgi:hypothetical protein